MFINNDFELFVIIIAEFVHFVMCSMALNVILTVLYVKYYYFCLQILVYGFDSEFIL